MYVHMQSNTTSSWCKPLPKSLALQPPWLFACASAPAANKLATSASSEARQTPSKHPRHPETFPAARLSLAAPRAPTPWIRAGRVRIALPWMRSCLHERAGGKDVKAGQTGRVRGGRITTVVIVAIQASVLSAESWIALVRIQHKRLSTQACTLPHAPTQAQVVRRAGSER